MPPAPPDSFLSLHQRALLVTGEYAQATAMLDLAITRTLDVKSPQLGQALAKRKLRRIQDEERLHYFVAAADDAGYSGDLTNARPIYDRVRQVRNVISHSAAITGPPASGTGRVMFVTYRGTARDLLPDPFVPSTFERLRNDCVWLHDHAMSMMFECKLMAFTDITGQELAEEDHPKRPGPLPLDGEPLPGG